MTRIPALFDRTLLARRRARAAKMPSDADFIHSWAASIVKERLEEVNKTFHTPVLISPNTDCWIRELGVHAEKAEDQEVLRLDNASHDLIVSGLTLHWHNDPVGQLIQMRRALRPDGLMIAAMFGGETLKELRESLAAAEIERMGGISPRVAPMADIQDLGGLLQRAGFALPVADSLRLDVSYSDISGLMRDLRAMGETNILHDRHKYPLRRDVLKLADEIYRSRFPGDDGRLRATFDIVFLTGWAPHESQQQPLKPGSATRSLADALNSRSNKN